MYWKLTGEPREGKGKRELGGRGRVGTRGYSLHEWIKERDWCGVVFQKVRIILEASCDTAKTKNLLHPHTSLDQRRTPCCSTIQSFKMEGRGRMKQRGVLSRFVVLAERAQILKSERKR